MLLRPNFRLMTIALFLSLGLFIALTFRHYGISNDEEVQHVYGRLLLDFYTSGFSDQSAFHYRNLYLYGGFFDLLAALIERAFSIPADSIWVWDMRHLLSALFGLSGIVAAYRIAELLGGERAGFAAALLLAITGAWSGAMFTHTKDIPFATCMAWALYYSMLISHQLPKPPLALVIKLGIAVGFALGMRIGGAFAVIYLLLMLGLAGWSACKNWRERISFWWQCKLHLIPAGLIAFVLMAIFWPWGVMAPDHPLQAAKAFSHFTFNMLTVMDGEVMNIGQVPRDYLLAYLLVRLPEIFLLGLGSILLIGFWRLRRFKMDAKYFLAWFTLLVAALFPLAFILFDKPALYNGVRHFTFILPPLAALAGLGLCACADALKPSWRRTFAASAMLLALGTALTLVKLHPYEYVYYNHLAGNLAEAEKEWEGDYWSSSLREAALMLDEKVKGEANDGLNQAPYRVAVCAESIQGDAYLDHRFQITSDWVSADFFISSTNMNCDKVLQGQIIGKVERMGATLAVVKDRRVLLAHERMPRPAPR